MTNDKKLEKYFMHIMMGMSKGTLERYECSNAKEMSDKIFAYYEQLKLDNHFNSLQLSK